MNHIDYENILRKMYSSLAWDALLVFTKHHRIQGSKELWNVAKTTKETLEEEGIEAKLHRVEPGAKNGFIDTPASWDALEGELTIKIGDKVIARFDLIEHPTLIATHSPGGEGCGELVVCEKPPCIGEVVLATGYLYEIYKRIDAKLILYYMPNRYRDAVPYAGLFLTPHDEKKATVMNIPYSLAQRLIETKRKNPRKKIVVCWKAVTAYHNEGLPILISGNTEQPELMYISHLCHPKPGAHDNASGSAANLAIAFALRGLENKINHCNVWVPEYTGTVFLPKYLGKLPKYTINLDMVGSKQYITGSSLTIVNPPRYLKQTVPAALWLATRKFFDNIKAFSGSRLPSIRWGPSPYTMGSDHDVVIGWGREASMLNEWPSKYYHTDKDTVDTISSECLALTARTALYAGLILATKPDSYLNELVKNYERFMRSWYFSEAISQDFSISFIKRNLIKQPVSISSEKPLLDSPLISRTIYKILGSNKYNEIRRIKGAIDYLGLYAPLATVLGIKNHMNAYKAETITKWSRKEDNLIKEAWETILSVINF